MGLGVKRWIVKCTIVKINCIKTRIEWTSTQKLYFMHFYFETFLTIALYMLRHAIMDEKEAVNAKVTCSDPISR